MSKSGAKTIFHIQNSDFSTVQGSTQGYYLSRFFAEKGDAHIFAPLETPVEGATNHLIPIEGIFGVILLNIVLLPYWVYHFATKRPDVVFCYENVITPAILARRVFGAHVVFNLPSAPYGQAAEFLEENDRSLLFRVFLKVGRYAHAVALKEAHDIFVVSDSLREMIATSYGLDTTHIHILPLGVDTDRFRPLNGDSPYERVSIVYIGAINETRGIEMFAEAVAGLPDAVQSNLRVDLYGDGPSDYIESVVDTLDDGHAFKLYCHGKIPHENIPTRVRESDIAVSPIPPYESYQVSSPAKVFEYLALGLPVVASRITPHERILDDGKNSVLYTPDSVADLRQQLLTLIEDETLRSKFSEKARSSALEYDWNRRFVVVDEVLNLTTDASGVTE